MHTKARQTSKNNEKAVKLALCLIKTRILRLARERIQNKLSRMTDHTVGKLESSPLTLKNEEKWTIKLDQDNPLRITLKKTQTEKLRNLGMLA